MRKITNLLSLLKSVFQFSWCTVSRVWFTWLYIVCRRCWYRSFKMGNSILAAALTMTLLILPIIIVSSQEAIRAVPNSVREASFGLGANKWQTIRRVVLPAALPGILTGFILSLSRALGETAPLVLIGIPTILLATPRSILDQFSALPIQIFTWAKMPQEEFQNVASAGIIVLLVILILMNGVAIILRNKFSKNSNLNKLSHLSIKREF